MVKGMLVSLDETVKYHNKVFTDNDLPVDTYTLQPIADAIGEEKAAALVDTDPEFLSKSLKAGWEHAPDVTDSAIEYLGDTYDVYKREREQDIRDLEEEDPSRIENAPFGPHADKGDAPKPNEVSDASSPDAAKMKAALMPSEKDGDVNRRNELLHKSADQLTEAEALDLGRWYHGLQSSDPLRGELDRMRRDYYRVNYGDDPAAVDETGRMKPVQPRRAVPEKPTPAKSADGHTLKEGIRRIAGAVAKRAGKDGLANAAKVLQTGLNLAGQALKVDGDPGPKTRAGLAATVAKKGAAKTEEAVAMGGFKRMVEAGRVSGTPKSGLRDTVEKDVQPLFGTQKPKVAAETLQSSLNGLNAEAAEKRRAPKPEPLKIDGEIGPKTEDAFASALADHGAEKLTKRYSDDLGFGFG